MGDRSDAATWSRTRPTTSGYYDVRPCLAAWDLGLPSEYEAPGAQITYVDVTIGRFNAGQFGGDIAEPLWEWRGPIRVPAALPERL